VTKVPESETRWRREVARCHHEIAEAERLLGAGHLDIQGLCLALHDWAQELRILHREREQWMSGS
jgi:hypothetical protein